MASTIPAGSLVLVTGATGYVATHTVKELLERGFRVRGTVRSVEKGDLLKERVFKHYGDKFTYIVVENIENDGAFDDAVKGVQAILHIASPLYRGANATDLWKFVIEPAKKGTTGILHSAHKHNKDVKRIVITSSLAAMMNTERGPNAVLTEDDWSSTILEGSLQKGKDIPPFEAYAVSKTWAERAAWEFMEEQKPAFDITTIPPPLVAGPVISPIPTSPQLNRSNIELWGYLTGDPKYTKEFAVAEPASTIVDVRDVAYAHVEALLRPAASNLRIAVSYRLSSYQEFLDAIAAVPSLRAAFPNANWGVPGARPDPAKPRFDVDASRSKEVLGIKYRDVRETAVDLAQSLLEWGKQLKWEGCP